MSDKDVEIPGIMMTAQRFMDEGRLLEAIKALQFGISKYPDNPDLFGMLGLAASAAGEWRNALKFYEIAIHVDSKKRDTFQILKGLAYYNLGDFDSAILCLGCGLELNPSFSQGRWFLARCYHKTGRLHEAFNEYKILLNSYQGEMLAITHYMIADLYRTKGQVDDAIIELKKGLAISPNMGEAHDWLGKCYEQKGLMDKAKSEYQIANKLGFIKSDLSKE